MCRSKERIKKGPEKCSQVAKMKYFNFLLTTFIHFLNFMFWAWITFIMRGGGSIFSFKPSPISSSLENWFPHSGSHLQDNHQATNLYWFPTISQTLQKVLRNKRTTQRHYVKNLQQSHFLSVEQFIVHPMLQYKFSWSLSLDWGKCMFWSVFCDKETYLKSLSLLGMRLNSNFWLMWVVQQGRSNIPKNLETVTPLEGKYWEIKLWVSEQLSVNTHVGSKW